MPPVSEIIANRYQNCGQRKPNSTTSPMKKTPKLIRKNQRQPLNLSDR